MQGLIEPIAIAWVIEIKKRLQGNLTGQGLKFFVDPNQLARAPGVEPAVGQFGHNRGICLHPVSEEGGLNKFPLSLPKLAFAGNESVSKHWPKRSCAEVFDVVF